MDKTIIKCLIKWFFMKFTSIHIFINIFTALTRRGWVCRYTFLLRLQITLQLVNHTI